MKLKYYQIDAFTNEVFKGNYAGVIILEDWLEVEPVSGGDEDPVAGSIHTGLTPYWAKILNKTTLKAYQASSRGGILNCKPKDDKVILSGLAVKYLEGTITI
jgi:predicted PhzF superfamily epimerase YddE/YHI9